MRNRGQLWAMVFAYGLPVIAVYWAPWFWEYHFVLGGLLVIGQMAMMAWLPGAVGSLLARRMERQLRGN